MVQASRVPCECLRPLVRIVEFQQLETLAAHDDERRREPVGVQGGSALILGAQRAQEVAKDVSIGNGDACVIEVCRGDDLMILREVCGRSGEFGETWAAISMTAKLLGLGRLWRAARM